MDRPLDSQSHYQGFLLDRRHFKGYGCSFAQTLVMIRLVSGRAPVTACAIVFATTAKDSCQASRAVMIPILPVV